MDIDVDRISKLIFPQGLPDTLRDNKVELANYLNKLGNCKVDELKKERARLAEENANVVEQIQDLAISNFQTFISTAENFRSIYNEFNNANTEVDELLKKLPQLTVDCEIFMEKSREIIDAERMNTLTLQKNAQLLEILELPQLMERCLRHGCYEEALELANYVQKLNDNHGNIPVIKSIVQSVERLWHTMLVQLIAQLRTDLQLPKCLQIVSYLRRMQAFDANELKLKFLQARNTWLISTLKAIPIDDVQQHLTKTIEVTRINLFSIITQYKAIFPDESNEDSIPTIMLNTKGKHLQGVICNGDRLFQSWLHEKISDFLKTLENDLEQGVFSFDTILGQCMYFGLSFSRIGADFRSLMAPIFVKVIKKNFINAINITNDIFEKEMDKYSLINKVTVYNHRMANNDNSAESESYSPPETLLDFHPLATLCNGYLNALNQLRLCAPIALANDVTVSIQQSLEMVSQRLLAFYRQEQQAFTTNERETFHKLCNCFSQDLLPYIQKCIHGLFKPSILCSHLGVSLSVLEDNIKITYLDSDYILSHIQCIL